MAILTILFTISVRQAIADIFYIDMSKIGNTRLQNAYVPYADLGLEFAPGIGFPNSVTRISAGNLEFDIPQSGNNAWQQGKFAGGVHKYLNFDVAPALKNPINPPGIAKPTKIYVLLVWTQLRWNPNDFIGMRTPSFWLTVGNAQSERYGHELVLGKHFRSFLVGDYVDSVDPFYTKQAYSWSHGDQTYRMDLLEIPVPDNWSPTYNYAQGLSFDGTDGAIRMCIAGIAIENNVDSVSPTSNLTVTPSDAWSSSTATASIAATDNAGGKGVKEIHYTLNMGTEQVVTGSTASFTLTEEGIHSIAYWAVDNAGNVEATKYGTVRIDKTAPTVDGYVLSGKLLLMASDTRSGVAGIKYSLDGAAAADYTTALTIPVGAHTYTYWSVDNAGNESIKETVLVGATVSVTLAPTSVYASKSATATIKLSVAAPAGGVTILLASDNPAVSIAPSVKLNAGATSINVPVQTVAVSADTSVVITASIGGTEAYGTLTVLVPFPKTLTIAPNVITGGNSAVGTITLQSNAPVGGQVVTLTSMHPDVTVPPAVTVPAGALTATFDVITKTASRDYSAAIYAEADGAGIGTTVLVKRVVPKSVTFAPSTVIGGNAAVGTVTLNVAAPVGGAVVQLKSTSSIVAVPAFVTVAEGQTTATFDIATSVTSRTVLTNVQATAAGVRIGGVLTVSGVNVTSITLAPSSVLGGLSTTGTVNLNTNAPVGGLSVQLYTTSDIAGVPVSVTVPAGQKNVSFTVTTLPVSASAQTQIVGKYLGIAKTATLTVQAAAVSTLTLNPTSVKGGTNSTLTIKLTGLAGPAGLVVTLTSSNLTAATIPATVTVPAGTDSVDVTVTTNIVAANTTSTLTAKTAAGSKTVVLNVTK